MLKMVVEVGDVKLKSLSESLDSEDTTNPFQKKRVQTTNHPHQSKLNDIFNYIFLGLHILS